MRNISPPALLQWIYNRLIPAFLVCIALSGLWLAGQQAEPSVYNLFSRWMARPIDHHSPVTLILMDDESLLRLENRFGPAPWPRQTYLEIFKRVQASHPTLIAFDGHFMNRHTAQDEAFFKALAQFPHWIGGLVLAENEPGTPQQPTRLDERRNTVAQFPTGHSPLRWGVVSMQEDEDGVIRRLDPWHQLGYALGNKLGRTPGDTLNGNHTAATSPGRFTNSSGKPDAIPSLAYAAAQTYQQTLRQRSQTAPQAEGSRPTLPTHALSTRPFYLHWHRLIHAAPNEYARSHTAIPLWQFFEPTDNPSSLASTHSPPAPIAKPSQPPHPSASTRSFVPDLQGKIALIGTSATLYRDYHQTPLSNRHLGPDIHATAIDNLLQSQAIYKVPLLLNAGLLFFVVELIFILRFSVGSLGKTLLYTLGAMIIYGWLAFWVLATHAWWLDVATPILFMGVAFVAGSAARIFFKERQLAAMERNLSQLVDPEVFREIRRLSHILKPGGQKLEITSMFVDIRNFTTLAERLQPQEVTELLNAFYGEIVNIVFHYHGTIDKFMGDGILIIFGAPLPNAAHRPLALQAAQEMLVATARLSQRWQDMQGIEANIGISVHSGMAFVGFLGPTDKLEYTAVGDTVNICVRLQEHAKQFQTRLIVSEASLLGSPTPAENESPEYPPEISEPHQPDILPIRPDDYLFLGNVPVRGREGAIRIYTLPTAFLAGMPPPP